jgi:hypothetical protein
MAALGFAVGSVEDASAQGANREAVGNPAADRVWAGCVLNFNAVQNIVTSIDQSPSGDAIGTPDVSFGVVYALTKPNQGQPLTAQSGGGFTGPVICISGQGIAIETTNEDEDIPTTEDQGVARVDLRDLSQALVARTSAENSFCHTVSNPAEVSPPAETNTDCFRIPGGGGVDPPMRNRVWAGCVLDTITVGAIRTAVQAGRDIDDPNVEVSYVVIYSKNNANNGQPLTPQPGGGFTGPVICRAEGPPIGKTTETDAFEDTTAALIDTSEALVLRYGYPAGAPASSQRLESRFCHSVANSNTRNPSTAPPETNTDCFRVFPSQ